MFLVRKHVITILIALEIIFLASTILFVVSSVFLDDMFGQICGLLILTVAASENALALAIVIVYYRIRGGISTDLLTILKS